MKPKINKHSWIHDSLKLMTLSTQAIAEDEFSKCFKQEKRVNIFKMNFFEAFVYSYDVIVRHFFLFPFRLLLLLISTIIFLSILPLVNFLKNDTMAFLSVMGSQITYHSQKPSLQTPHLFVSNHTSVIDYLVLSADKFPHATIAQSHGGVIGYFLKSVLTLNGSLHFNRNQKNDRTVIAKKMKDHVENTLKSPLLIFPEGTCVNNEYTVLFHKGAFEFKVPVIPIAIKYNKQKCDAYWSSKTQTFTQHVFYLMTRWNLVADVWYLPSQSIQPGETAAEFAGRVKAMISDQAGLKNLEWDGYLKNYAAPVEKRKKIVGLEQQKFSVKVKDVWISSQDISSSPLLSSSGKRSRSLTRKNEGTSRRMYQLKISESSSSSYTSDLMTKSSLTTTPPNPKSPSEKVKLRNRILVAVEEQDCRVEMLRSISAIQHDVVNTWKSYTKMRDSDNVKRRIEYNSWRVWFKQRIEKNKPVNHVLDDDERRNLIAVDAADAGFSSLDFQRGENETFEAGVLKKGILAESETSDDDDAGGSEKFQTPQHLGSRGRSLSVDNSSFSEDITLYKLASYTDLVQVGKENKYLGLDNWDGLRLRLPVVKKNEPFKKISLIAVL